MAKPNVVTAEMWVKIKTDYEFGMAANAIAKKFSLSHPTILRKAKIEGWTHGKFSSEHAVIKQKIESVYNSVDSNQQPLVKAKFLSMIERQELINNFIDGAISLNLKNLQAVHRETNPEKRIRLTAQMKANFADLSGIGRVHTDLPNPDPLKDSEINDPVQIYIPDNGRD